MRLQRKMMVRAAGLLILLSQLIVLMMVVDMSGITAIWFSFVGTPLLGVGLLVTAYLVLTGRERVDSTD